MIRTSTPVATPVAGQSAARDAFTIPELLVVLGIFSVFALVASKLLQTTVRVGYSAGCAQIAGTQFDAAARAMREDVWSAVSITSKGDRAIMLTLSGGETVEWTVDPSGTFTRTQNPRPPRNWQTHAAGATLARDGPALVVHLPLAKDSRAGEVRLMSQLMLAGKLTQ